MLGKKRSIRRIYSHRSSTGCTRKQKRNRNLESRDGESGLEDCLPQHGRPFKFINFLRSLQYLVLASKFNTASSSIMGPPAIPQATSSNSVSSIPPFFHNQYFQTPKNTPFQFSFPPNPLSQCSPNVITFGAAAHSMFSPQINPEANAPLPNTYPSASDTSLASVPNELSVVHLCPGVWVVWHPGSPWDTYAYQQHDIPSIKWTLLSVKENQVLLRSRNCLHQLKSDDDLERGNCSACHALLRSDVLLKFIRRAALPDAPPHTPWTYLNFVQTRRMLFKLTQKVKRFELEVTQKTSPKSIAILKLT